MPQNDALVFFEPENTDITTSASPSADEAQRADSNVLSGGEPEIDLMVCLTIDEAQQRMHGYSSRYTTAMRDTIANDMTRVGEKYGVFAKYHISDKVVVAEATYGWGASMQEGDEVYVYNARLLMLEDSTKWVYYVKRATSSGDVMLFLAAESDLTTDYEEAQNIIPDDASIAVLNMMRAYLTMRRKTRAFMHNNIYRNSNEMTDLQDKIKMLDKDNVFLEGLLSSALPKSKDVQREGVEIAQLLENCYSDVYVDSTKGIMKATTKVVKAVYAGVTYNLGAFNVSFDWRKLPTFELAEGYKSPSESYIHPHIDKKGHACFGDFVGTINAALRQRRYLYVMQLVWEFLHALDPHNDYHSPHNWLSAEEKRDVCPECIMTWDECECNTCDHCGNSTEDCSCERCPDSNDYLRHGANDSYCNGCGSYSDGSCNY